ncbi:MAG: hypothetical protein H6567_11075 [Lewinellaceae bacterium]|nr:hypothetical protein [Lewinellaceae bacterium]
MISERDIQLLEDLSLEKINLKVFRERFSIKLTQKNLFELLAYIIDKENEKLLRSINSYFFKTSFIPESCEIYNKLLIENWHRQHDDIASILQFHLKCPCSTIYFEKSINLKFDYLFETDDFEPYVTKCMWGIAKINSNYSKEVLVELAKSEYYLIKKAATYQVERLNLVIN